MIRKFIRLAAFASILSLVLASAISNTHKEEGKLKEKSSITYRSSKMIQYP
ncbi:hypothetical protein [Clostridium polynesiense]|uniref:hypothetical protein n=1 Tax=Clostridium polynesiense TaxID=1325933 RepID=UPI000B24EC53|nr:hypothetical protein [Clostridium polynesiense]